MNFNHATLAPPEGRQYSSRRMGEFARDVLSIVWVEAGITTQALGVRLGDNGQVSHTIYNLRELGYLNGQPLIVGGQRGTRWAIADAGRAEAALCAPERPPRDGEKPYERKFTNPDFSQPPGTMPVLPESPIDLFPPRRPRERRPRETVSSCEASRPKRFVPSPRPDGPPARARQQSPDFQRDPTTHPVVRAGSLDALRHPSLLFGLSRGEPEARLAVVEAKGATS